MNRNLTRAAIALACCTTLTACNSYRSSAEKAVRETLKDPESAKFGDFYYNEKTKQACLAVNAKNSMGGYTGETPMFLTREGDGWGFPLDLNKSSFEECKKQYADVTLGK